MALKERFTEEMRAAMRAKNAPRLSTIRLMLAAVQEHGIRQRNESPSDDEILALLAKMLKQREDSASIYDQGGRPELAAKEREEMVVIREFMPRQMSPEETRAAIADAVAASGAASMKDMGKVMAALKERYTGQMDFAKANGVVKELLSR